MPFPACMHSGFSAQPLFTSGLIATFNVLFTSTPIVAFAVFEQDLKQVRPGPQGLHSQPELQSGCCKL